MKNPLLNNIDVFDFEADEPFFIATKFENLKYKGLPIQNIILRQPQTTMNKRTKNFSPDYNKWNELENNNSSCSKSPVNKNNYF